MFQRPSSMFDFASILVWLIAVLTAATGPPPDLHLIPVYL